MVAIHPRSAQTALRLAGSSRPYLSGAVSRVASRRLVSTITPPKKSGTWKGTFFRWGLAGGAVYFYNTSSIFAQSPGRKYITFKSHHC